MEHTLTLEVPETIFEPLARAAGQTGRTPEELALEWLTAAVRSVGEDPVEDFIGAFPTAFPDWADRHDAHLGQTVMLHAAGKGNEGD